MRETLGWPGVTVARLLDGMLGEMLRFERVCNLAAVVCPSRRRLVLLRVNGLHRCEEAWFLLDEVDAISTVEVTKIR